MAGGWPGPDGYQLYISHYHRDRPSYCHSGHISFKLGPRHLVKVSNLIKATKGVGGSFVTVFINIMTLINWAFVAPSWQG